MAEQDKFPEIKSNDTNLQDWLRRHNESILTLKKKIPESVYSAGHLHFIPLEYPSLSATMTLTEGEITEGRSVKGGDSGEHTIVIAPTKSIPWAKGVTPPSSELTIYSLNNNEYCPGDKGNTLNANGLILGGIGGRVPMVGAIGRTWSNHGFLGMEQRTNGLLIWTHPNIILSTVDLGKPETPKSTTNS